MLIKRRIANLERTWPRCRSLLELVRETQSVARLTGMAYDTAFDRLLVGVVGEEFDQMTAEAEALIGRYQGISSSDLRAHCQEDAISCRGSEGALKNSKGG